LLDVCVAIKTGERAQIAKVTEKLDLVWSVCNEGVDGVVGISSPAKLIVVSETGRISTPNFMV
jgi:hypothetical protein